MNGAELIAKERERQINGEGFTAERDDEYVMGEMLGAAISYTGHALEIVTDEEVPGADLICSWPDGWDGWWKPSAEAIPNLVKAGALIAAEIDRLQRLAAQEKQAA